jgi:hypothetical protein
VVDTEKAAVGKNAMVSFATAIDYIIISLSEADLEFQLKQLLIKINPKTAM